MQENQQAQAERLARLLSGNATEQDAAAASGEAWEQARQVWEKTAPPADWSPDVDKAWQRFQVKAMARTAAEPLPGASMENPVHPYAESKLRWWLSAAAAVLLLIGGYWLAKHSPAMQHEVYVHTQAGQKLEVQLPDGSKVWLNQNSSLAYDKSFSKENRQVKLTGEAYFEVEKAEGKRFTILAENTITEVIGTAFNLRAYQGEAVRVQVVHGKVAFAGAARQDAVFLEAGEQATFLAQEALVQKEPIADTNFSAWHKQELQFVNTSLEELARVLSAYFNTRIEPAAGIRVCRFTAHFKDPALQEVLDVLRLTGNFSITPVAGGYRISGKPCQ